jgi:hypothetical protein
MSSLTLLFHLVDTSDLEFDYWSTADLITKFGARLVCPPCVRLGSRIDVYNKTFSTFSTFYDNN